MNSKTEQTADTGGGEGAIVIEDMTKTFDGGNIIACEDIDLTVSADEFVVLLGPSGCGKTTTLRCIAGLEVPDSGSITIGTEDVTHTKPKDRDLAFVFQNIALFPHMSVKKNIQFGLDMKSDLSGEEKADRVQETARLLGIEDLLDRKPSELSGGQQQRVSLGRAMVTEPKAFLFDEPFSALDANLRDQMRTEVKRLQRNLNTAMVFVTHDQEEAMTLGDKIVIMEAGRIQQIGSPYEIYNDPQNLFVAQFIGSPSSNLLQGQLQNQNGELRFESDLVEIPLPTAPSSLEAHVGSDVTLGVRPEDLDLEDSGLFDASISVIEPQGHHDIVHLEANGTDLRAIVDQNAVSPGTVSVDFDADQVWLFGANGTRLL